LGYLSHYECFGDLLLLLWGQALFCGDFDGLTVGVGRGDEVITFGDSGVLPSVGFEPLTFFENCCGVLFHDFAPVLFDVMILHPLPLVVKGKNEPIFDQIGA